MSIKIYALILAAIFIVHNVEEYLSFDEMKKMGFKFLGKNRVTRGAFLFAITFLSLLVVLLSVLNYLFDNDLFQKANTIVLFALTINALQHVIASIWHRRVLPGTLSAAFLILPFTVFYFIKHQEAMKWDFLGYFEYAIVSIAIMVLSIYGSLWLGIWTTRSVDNN